MYEDPKEKNTYVGCQNVESEKRSESSLIQKSLTWIHAGILVPMVAGVLQILIGLTLVSISILGLLEPVWISAVLSILGSVSSMAGVYLIYHVISKQETFNTLINKAIRRVIEAQN